MPKFNLNFFKKAQTRVGLDIGSYNLKAVEIEEKKGSFRILRAGIMDIRQEKDIPEAIKKLLKETDILANKVNISVSGEDVVARYLSLPEMTETELKKAIAFQLEDYIPFKPDEVYVDYYVLGKEEDSKNKIRVFLVAVKKNLLDEKAEFARKAGFAPQVITTDALAIKNTFYFNYPAKNEANIAILNIGDKITNLLITRQQIPYFIRDSRFGGDVITALIQTKLRLERPGAEKLKHNQNEQAPEISKITRAALGNLLNEIFVSLDFYENLTEQKLDELYLTGGASQLTGLKDFLNGYLNLKIIPLEPAKNFSLSADISRETIAELSPYLAIAVGLALEKP